MWLGGLLGGFALAAIILGWVFRVPVEYGIKRYRESGPRAVYSWLRNYESSWVKPNVSWERGEPASAGIDPDRLAELQDYVADRSTEAFLIVKGGRLVHEWYRPGRGPNTDHSTASLAKAITGSLALMLALNDSLMNLDDPASKYIPQWRDDEEKSRITIRQLATHSSGLEDVMFEGESGWKKTYGEQTNERFPLALTRAGLIHEPGETYSYSGVGYYALAYAITRSLRRAPQRDIPSLLDERVMKPLGVPPQAWSLSYGETYELDGMKLVAIGSGGRATPRAVAKIGQLLLQRGRWDGAQLISAAVVDNVFHYGGSPEQREKGPEPAATMGWWVNDDGFWPYLPSDAVVGAGLGHEILLIIPSHDLVVVRLGHTLAEPRVWGPIFWTELGDHLLKPLMECLRERVEQAD
jgi:CubicO group peptidase (beta-lactamase class C family)